jgi:predicted Zn-dependent peptidase
MDETIEQIESVTESEVVEMANQLFDRERIAITVLGNLDGLRLTKENLVC